MKAFVFPGQGAQFVGMGKDLYENNETAKELFEKANEILGYRITDIMFEGTDEDLKQTKVTQPAVFLHSVISAICMGEAFNPDMTAGHSLGEFSALVAAGALSFEDGLKLVYARAMAMQKACEAQPSTMAAIIGLPDEKVVEVCEAVSKMGKGVCVPANFNNPGQLVISGDIDAINEACEQLKAAGAKRALPLKDAACQGRAAAGHRADPVPGSEVSRLSECGRAASYRSRRDQGEPHRPADVERTLDPDCAAHDRGRCHGLHRVWSRQGPERHDRQD